MDLTELEELLVEREEVIADHTHRDRDPDEHLERLIRASENLTKWSKEHRDELRGELAHYLTVQSYQKALAYCRGARGHRM